MKTRSVHSWLALSIPAHLILLLPACDSSSTTTPSLDGAHGSLPTTFDAASVPGIVPPLVDAAPPGQTAGALEVCTQDQLRQLRCQGTVLQVCNLAFPNPSPAWTATVDCAVGGGTCGNGACVGGCQPGATYCADISTEQSCSSNGTWSSRQCPGVPCSPSSCWECTINARQCRGNIVQQCSTTSSPPKWVDNVACAGACIGGYCEGEVCPAGKRRCHGNTVETCDSSGTWQATSVCPAGSPCIDGAGAICQLPTLPVVSDAGIVGPPPVPTPDAAIIGPGLVPPPNDAAAPEACSWLAKRCAGDVLQYCDGTGWVDLQQCATGCSATGSTLAACSEGCRTGEIKCAGDDVVSCRSGSYWSTESWCNKVYDPGRCENGRCVGKCMSSQKPVCVAGGVQSCGSDLTWGAPVPCANQTCVSGACTGVCEAGATGVCNGASIELCDGTGSWRSSTCQSADLCVDRQGCLDCKPGQLGCSSDKKTARTCSSAGKWQDSAACVNQTCVGGACVGVCTTGSYASCNGATIQRCNDQGQWQTETCTSSDLCLDGVGCLTCKPGSHGCYSDNKSTAVCDASGKYWGKDAPCANQTCVDGACAGVCQVGSYGICAGAAIQKCDSQGQWGTQTCTSADVCAEGRGCLLCKPATSGCSSDKKSTTVCDEAGSRWNAGGACVNQTCVDGACTGVCAVGSYGTCTGATIQKCDSQGQWGTQTCASADVCADGKGCLTCKPGARLCSSDKKSTTVCDDSGSRWNTGVSCADQTCVDGACSGVCQVGSYGTCTDATIQKCNDQGQWGTQTCTSADLCAAGKGCLTCKPATTGCSSDKRSTTVCDDSGGRWNTGASCVNQTCFEGACVGSCAPVAATCSGYTASRCSTMGVPEQVDCDWGCVASTGCATSLNVCTTVRTCAVPPCSCTTDAFGFTSCTGTWGPDQTVCSPRTCKQTTDCGTKGSCVSGRCQAL
jgi:hypothetical protein